MAGADGNDRFELEQWKKALLSRDFDLVHTQLLMLDGDVTPSERAQLVQEIFAAVQQIEELATAKPHSQGAENEPKHSAAREPQTDRTSSATSRSSRPKDTEGAAKRRARRNPYDCKIITDLPKNELGHRYVKCPVCLIANNVNHKGGIREDWYCNSCRLFKLRLEKKFAKRLLLPSCDHKGKKINSCKGCRRYNLEKFWMAKRQRVSVAPFGLPRIASDGSSSDSERSDSDGDW